MTDVIMPKMGDAMEEGTLVEWLKKDGEKVRSGEVIGTIQTDKATLELEAPSSGTLAGLLIQGGQTVPVGQPIAAILKEGESLPATWGKGASTQAKASSSPPGNVAAPQQTEGAEVPAPANAPIELQQAADANPRFPGGAGAEAGLSPKNPDVEAGSLASRLPGPDQPEVSAGRLRASPLAKRVASELGIEIAAVRGTGPGGRIIERDVHLAAQNPAAQVAAPAASVGGDQTVALNRLRQLTAQKTVESKQQVPHFYVTLDVDLEQIMALREMFEADGGDKPSVNDFVIKACAHALMEMPVVNSEFRGQTLLQHGSVHVGMAVAIEEGLTVPVIKNAQTLSIKQIGAASKELARKARENKLSLDELTGNTFAISNMGMLNVDSFSAIIIPPNACIVAVGTAKKRAVVNDEDELEIRWRMNITGSFDHRVVDGAVGAKFMNVVREYLEAPTRLLT